MQDHDSGPVVATSVAAATRDVAVSSAARKLISGDDSTEMYFSRLLEASLYRDAILLLPALAPIRKAIWWSCLCAWHVKKPAPTSLEDRALGAAVRWVQQPTRQYRVEANDAGAGLDWNTAPGCCAAAVSWACHRDDESQDWTVGDLPLAARLCANAVDVASRQTGDGIAESAQRRLLMIGLEVAMGKLDWRRKADQS